MKFPCSAETTAPPPARLSSPVHPPACPPEWFRILENAAGARRGGLRFPALFAIRHHAPLNLRARQRRAFEHRAQRDVRLQQRTRAISTGTFTRNALSGFRRQIHEPERLDRAKCRRAQCTAFMRNAPPTLPGMPSRNSTPLKLSRLASTETIFQFRARAAMQPSPTISILLKCGCARQITTAHAAVCARADSSHVQE